MTRRLLLAVTAALLLAAPAASAAGVDTVDDEDLGRCVWVTMANGTTYGYCIR